MAFLRYLAHDSACPTWHAAMVRKSNELEELLRAAGFIKGTTVSRGGIRLVSQLAKDHKLRDWAQTQTLDDYDALIAVTRRHFINRWLARAKLKRTGVSKCTCPACGGPVKQDASGTGSLELIDPRKSRFLHQKPLKTDHAL